jgi:hypothetical protein
MQNAKKRFDISLKRKEIKMTARKFGETVEGYGIPVMNEREIRASAGILFLVIFSAWMRSIFFEDFLLVKYFITFFFTDFIVRVLVNPKYSPTLIIGRWIVNKQTPEYVGAAQKKFAWTIGLVLSTIMFFTLVVINSYTIFTSLICLICLIFLFFESAFGICLGCLFYPWFYKEKTQYCPGEICEVKAKQEIQKISLVQIGIVFGFVAYIIFIAYFFNNNFSQQPNDTWGILSVELSKQVF